MNETPDNKLYIGTEGCGLNILDLKDLAFYSDPSEVEFEHILASETPEGLSNLSVQTVFQDSFGNIWLGGYGSGVNFIPKKEPFFNTINYLPLIGNSNSLNYKSVEDICIDNKNNVWVANGLGGICIYNENKKIGQIQAINGDPKFNAMCLHEDHDNNIWIGTADGRIYKYDVQKKSYQLLKIFDNLNNIPIYSFFEDSRKNLWMSTDIGLYYYNIATKK